MVESGESLTTCSQRENNVENVVNYFIVNLFKF